MAYYYALDASDYFVKWSVGVPFSGSKRLADGVDVPEALKTCACNVRAYKYVNGQIIYNPDRDDVKDLYVPTLGVETYAGAYEFIPKVEAQVAETAEKYMESDLTVCAIPYYDVSNTTGGSTVYIGTLEDV